MIYWVYKKSHSKKTELILLVVYKGTLAWQLELLIRPSPRETLTYCSYCLEKAKPLSHAWVVSLFGMRNIASSSVLLLIPYRLYSELWAINFLLLIAIQFKTLTGSFCISCSTSERISMKFSWLQPPWINKYIISSESALILRLGYTLGSKWHYSSNVGPYISFHPENKRFDYGRRHTRACVKRLLPLVLFKLRAFIHHRRSVHAH